MEVTRRIVVWYPCIKCDGGETGGRQEGGPAKGRLLMASMGPLNDNLQWLGGPYNGPPLAIQHMADDSHDVDRPNQLILSSRGCARPYMHLEWPSRHQRTMEIIDTGSGWANKRTGNTRTESTAISVLRAGACGSLSLWLTLSLTAAPHFQ